MLTIFSLAAIATAWVQVDTITVREVVAFPHTDSAPLSDVLAAVLADDRLLVIQRGVSSVAVFGEDGEYITTWGRAGRGPGEFLTPHAIGVLDSVVWVGDGSQRRVTWLDWTGNLIKTSPNPDLVSTRTRLPARFGAMMKGERFLLSEGFSIETLPLIEGLGYSVMLYDPGTMQTNELAHIRIDDQLMIVPTDGGRVQAFQPYSFADKWAVGRRGSFFVRLRQLPMLQGSRTVKISLFLVDGGMREDSIAIERRPLDNGAVDKWIQDLASSSQSWTSVAAGARLIRSRLFRPDFYPPVSDMLVDSQERIWLGLSAEGVLRDWLVLDGSLGQMFVARLPIEVDVLEARDETVWGVVLDDLDVPSLVRYEFSQPRSNGR